MSVVAFDKLCWAFHNISSEKVILYFFCKFVLFQKCRSVLERQNILAIYSNNHTSHYPGSIFYQFTQILKNASLLKLCARSDLLK